MSSGGVRVCFRIPDDRNRLIGKTSTPRKRKCSCVTASTVAILAIFAIFGLTAYNLLVNRYGPNHFHVHVGDEVALSHFTDDLSPKFCSDYGVRSWDRSHVYLLPSEAKVNASYHKEEHFEIIYARDSMVLDSQGFYLLTNSTVAVTGCRMPDSGDAPAEMVLFKGDYLAPHGWHRMEEDNNVLLRVEIPRDALCSNASRGSLDEELHDSSSLDEKPYKSLPNIPRLEYVVTESDTYYVILMEKLIHSRGHLRSGDIILNGTLSRTSYDVSDAIDVCAGHFVCHFMLDFDKDDVDIVIKIHDNPVTPMARSSFDTRCEARAFFWVMIFGVIPLVLVAVILPVFVWLFCVKLPARDTLVTSRQALPPAMTSPETETETERRRSMSCPPYSAGSYGSLVESDVSVQDADNS